MTEQDDAVDFALAAYREEGTWTVQELAHDVLDEVETLASALRRFPAERLQLCQSAAGVEENRAGLYDSDCDLVQVLMLSAG